MGDKYKLDKFLLLTELSPFHLPDYISKIKLNASKYFFRSYRFFLNQRYFFLSKIQSEAGKTYIDAYFFTESKKKIV